MRAGVRWAALAVAAFGVAAMAFATQTADEEQTPVPNKVQIAHWLETGLWVNRGLFLVGAIALLFAVVVLLGARRRRLAVWISALSLPIATVVLGAYIFVGGYFGTWIS